ncbi:hypothetical protein L6452_09187 [Arctium lappa]|uniref:Uncharacterized protein n=1 Tax=Arctium lappa TaxID=4217 RepID=A0ACB9DK64_ARCLA|nr:hypothetical protein L6452_09187 [Arctium lappa]
MAQIRTLRASVDKAFAAMDELLGQRAIQATTVNTTINTTLDTPPEIPENPITKPNENPNICPSVEATIIPETTIPTPLTTLVSTPLNTPLITPIATPKATKTPPLVSPSKIPDDTLSELLGINLTPKHQEQPSVNPTSPTQHQLVDDLSEKTLEPSPIASQNTEPLGTSVNMAIDSPYDDVEVGMTRVKRRTMYKKKLKVKKKERAAKKVEIAEDIEMEDISPPKRMTRQ